MISHEFDNNLNVNNVKGKAYLVTDGSKIEPLRPGMNINTNDVLVTDTHSTVIVTSNGQHFSIDSACSSCLTLLSKSQSQEFLDLEDLASSNADLNSLQQQISQGVDPSLLFEKTAAGMSVSSANAGFVVLHYNYAATLAKAGFDTTGLMQEGNEIYLNEAGVRYNDAVGGGTVLLSLDENQLMGLPNGMQTSVSFFIAGGSQPLLAHSLQIDPKAITLLQTELSKITSGGDAVVFSVQSGVNGAGLNTLTLQGTSNGHSVISLTFTAQPSENGLSVTASLVQYAPFDHLDETGTYVNINNTALEISFPLQAMDVGGDFLQSPEIITFISTDSAAGGGEKRDINNQPLDLISLYEQETARAYDPSLSANTAKGTVLFEADADKLLPQTFYIHDVDAFKSQLETLRNDAGYSVDTVTVSPATGIGSGQTQITITAFIAGNPVLDITLISKQATDGLGMTVETTFSQYQALNHPVDEGDNISTTYITADKGSVNIKVPIQVEDIDGSLLVDPQNASAALARLITFSVINDAIYVEESGIGKNTGLSEGSQSGSGSNITAQFQNGQTLTLDPNNEKSGDDFYFVTYSNGAGPVKLLDGSPLNAHDHTPEHPYLWNVFLHQTSSPSGDYPKEYLATTNHDESGLAVFKIILQDDGRYSFELLTAVNHDQGNGNNTLEIELQAYSKDNLNNISSLIRIPVILEDDIPPDHSPVSVGIINGSTEDVVMVINVFDSDIASSLQGADGAGITSIFNGIEWKDISTTIPTTVNLFSSVAPHAQIGTVNVAPRDGPVGDLTFTLDPNMVNATLLFSQNIQYEVTDVDGDTVTGVISMSSLNGSNNGANLMLFGGLGNDILSGGAGSNILVGGLGNDTLWGGDVAGLGDGVKDVFEWQAENFGSAGAFAIDTVKDFEIGIDVIDISGAIDTQDVFTFEELSDILSIQTQGGNTLIEIDNDAGDLIQQIIIEGKTVDNILGVSASGMTQSEILESILISGHLVVFDHAKTEFGTSSDDTLMANPNGERLIGGGGNDTLIAGLGNDILVGGEGNDLFSWSLSNIGITTTNTDTVADFNIGSVGAGDVIDISSILPSGVDSNSSLSELLDYISPEITTEGLTLHLSQVANSTEVQCIVLHNVELSDLGLSSGATQTQILDELILQQALKVD